MADIQIPLTHTHTYTALCVTLIVITYSNQNHRFIQQILAWCRYKSKQDILQPRVENNQKVWPVWQFQISALTLWSAVCSKLLLTSAVYFSSQISIFVPSFGWNSFKTKNHSKNVPPPLFEADNGKVNFWQSQTMQSAVRRAIFFFKIEKWI